MLIRGDVVVQALQSVPVANVSFGVKPKQRFESSKCQIGLAIQVTLQNKKL
jgi:hypothetical protein